MHTYIQAHMCTHTWKHILNTHHTHTNEKCEYYIQLKNILFCHKHYKFTIVNNALYLTSSSNPRGTPTLRSIGLVYFCNRKKKLLRSNLTHSFIWINIMVCSKMVSSGFVCVRVNIHAYVFMIKYAWCMCINGNLEAKWQLWVSFLRYHSHILKQNPLLSWS